MGSLVDVGTEGKEESKLNMRGVLDSFAFWFLWLLEFVNFANEIMSLKYPLNKINSNKGKQFEYVSELD